MKHILLKPEHNVTSFASTDDNRYILQSVHYNKEKQAIEATDGKIAIRVPVEKDEKEIFPPIENSNEAQDSIIPADKFEKVIKSMPRKKSLDVLNSVVLSSTDKNKIVLTTNDLDQQNDVKIKDIEGSYPNIDAILPKAENCKLKIAISAEILKSLVDYALKNSKDNLSPIYFSFEDNLSTVGFEVITNSGRAHGAFMPMRMG